MSASDDLVYALIGNDRVLLPAVFSAKEGLLVLPEPVRVEDAQEADTYFTDTDPRTWIVVAAPDAPGRLRFVQNRADVPTPVARPEIEARLGGAFGWRDFLSTVVAHAARNMESWAPLLDDALRGAIARMEDEEAPVGAAGPPPISTTLGTWLAIASGTLEAPLGLALLRMETRADLDAATDALVAEALEHVAALDRAGETADLENADTRILLGGVLHVLVVRGTWSALRAERLWARHGGDVAAWRTFRRTLAGVATRAAKAVR